jgi:tRNA threonylcarbamoyladenosine biosynthesis protein TsaB
MFLLSIETSTPVGSVALYENQKILASCELHISQSHSSQLIIMVKQLLDICQKKINDIQGIALAEGPGSYTGLRIGASTVKGLAYSLGQKQIFAINTLQVIAQQIIKFVPDDALVCPMIDARRMEVYCALFEKKLEKTNNNTHQIANFCTLTEAKIIDELSFSEILDTKKIYFVGDGMPKCKSVLERNKNAFFIENIYPNAKEVGSLTNIFLETEFSKEIIKNVDYFEPFYLKEFQSTQKS